MRLTPAYFSARDAGIFQKHGLDALRIDERKCFRQTPSRTKNPGLKIFRITPSFEARIESDMPK